MTLSVHSPKLKSFEAEEMHLAREMYHRSMLIGFVVWAAFGALDWAVARSLEHLHTLWTYRAVALGAGLLPWFASWTPWGRRYSRGLAQASFFCAAVSVSWMTTTFPEAGHQYYVGIFVIMSAPSLIVPWRMQDAALFSVVTVAAYFLINGIHFGTGEWMIIPASFFLGLSTFLVLSQGLTRAGRFRNHQLRAQLGEANAELERAREHAAQALASKERFFANLSHELRTPATLIIGPAEKLLEEEKHNERRHRLQIIHKNGLRLHRTVDALLDLAKIDSSELRNRPRNCRVETIVKSLVDEAQERARAENLELTLEVEHELAPQFLDPDHIETIALNLLTNALKFTPPGGTIRVTVSKGSDSVVLVVADTGPGIPVDQHSRVFDRFGQASSKEGIAGGTGLGLSLVAELCSLVQAKIKLESDEGKGTVFRVEFPSEPVPALEPSARGSESDYASMLSRRAARLDLQRPMQATNPTLRLTPSDCDFAPHVLLVEDHPDLREETAKGLAREFQVTAVHDGRRALEVLASENIDVVVTDIAMPSMGGRELIQRVRSSTGFRDIPIVVLSAYGEVADRVRGRELGAESYLIKPVVQDELLGAVRGVLRARFRLVGDFVTDDELGSGGQGDVLRGRHRTSGEVAAIKLLNGRELGAGGNVRLRQEAKILQELVHPNIVRTLDVGSSEPGFVFIAMELLDGMSLDSLCEQETPLADEEVVACARDMAAALAYLHARRIIHHDFKPANIMVSERYNARHFTLLDFGASIRAGIATERTTLGSVPYIPPELLCDPPSESPAIDIFAWGLTMAHLTLRCYSRGADVGLDAIAGHVEWVTATLRQRAESPLTSIVLEALHRDPSQRPSAQVLCQRI